MPAKSSPKQNLTISVDRELIRKAKVLAARQATSISGLLAKQIETLVGAEEAYNYTQKSALAHLDQGFHLGGNAVVSRAALHER